MITLIKILLAILGIIIISASISYGLYYKYMYVNLYRNFNSYMKNTERKYILVDVILRNAVYEAYMNAKEKHNTFEEKAYEELYEEVKTKW